MKLFLSSYHLGNRGDEFAMMFGENKRVAVVANSIDSLPIEMRSEKVQVNLNEIKNIGLQPTEVDLRDYFGKPEKLKNILDEYGGVWVRGGNAFVLRRAMKYSGMDAYIKSKIKTDYVYGGYSAGVCLLGPSLAGLELVDNPNNVPEKYQPEIIWEGLDVLNYLIIPHYKSDHPESAMVEKSVEYLITNKIPYKTLRDGDVIVSEKV